VLNVDKNKTHFEISHLGNVEICGNSAIRYGDSEKYSASFLTKSGHRILQHSGEDIFGINSGLVSDENHHLRISDQIYPNGKLYQALYSFTDGAEPFSRSCQMCSYSRTSQHFMEPEGSLPRSQ
jgi:hypothetical protein